MSKRPAPVEAFRFFSEFELGDNGEDAKTAPFRMTARSGDPINHWYWGRIVHDFSGMKHKPRIPIDYVHDDKDVMGYGNKFDFSSGDLVVSGALTPYRENDRASEVVHKQKLGVPYEASITFDDAKVEDIEDGQTVEVNGRAFTGPGVVVREWTLRGVAVCPYGYDSNTETVALSADSKVKSVEVIMSDETKVDELEAKDEQQTLESEAAVETVEEFVESDDAETDSAESAETTEASEVKADVEAQPETAGALSEGQRFLEEFGDRGGVWFAQGLSFEDAQREFNRQLREENEELKQKLTAKEAVSGEETAVEFSASETPTKTTLHDAVYKKA